MLLGDRFLLCPDEIYNAQQFIIIPFPFISLTLFFAFLILGLNLTFLLHSPQGDTVLSRV